MKVWGWAVASLAGAAVVAGAALVWAQARLTHGPHPTVAVFLPHAGGCGLYRYDVRRGDEELAARLPVDCTGVRASFAEGGQTAVAYFLRDVARDNEPMAFRLASGTPGATPVRLPLPLAGELVAFAFDPKGRLYAFTVEEKATAPAALDPSRAAPRESGDDDEDDRDEETAPYAVALGDLDAFPTPTLTTPTASDGTEAVARVFALDGNTYHVVDAAPTRCCVEGAPGARALPLFRALVDNAPLYVSAAALRQEPAWLPFDTPAARQALATAVGAEAAAHEHARWVALRTPTALFRTAALRLLGDEAVPHGPLVFFAGGAATIAPGFAMPPEQPISLSFAAPLLLVSEWRSGMSPQLYDLTDGRLVNTWRAAATAMFWPLPPR